MSTTGLRISALESKKNQGAPTTYVTQTNSAHRVNSGAQKPFTQFTSLVSPPSNSGRVHTKFQIAADALRNCAATPQHQTASNSLKGLLSQDLKYKVIDASATTSSFNY